MNLNHLLFLSQVHWQGTRQEVEQPEIKLVSTWDTDITSGGLTGYATTLASGILSNILFHLLL